MTDHLMQNYAPLPVTFVKGEGVWLWDSEGKKYLDALSGVAVCGLGHAHPAVTAAGQPSSAASSRGRLCAWRTSLSPGCR